MMPVNAFDPIPPQLHRLALQRDGEDFTLRMFPRHAPGSSIEPAYIIPPSLYRDLELAEHRSLPDLLEAFLSCASIDCLRDISNSKSKDPSPSLENVLLLSPSIHRAFRAGLVHIRTQSKILHRPMPGCGDGLREKCGMCKQHPGQPHGLLLGDGTPYQGLLHLFELLTSDPKGLCLPSNRLINIHHRFAAALHLFYIQDQVNRGWPRPRWGVSLPSPVSHFFKSLWLCLPQRLRVLCYTLLGKLGRKMYPLEAHVWAQRLPFGLYVKRCTRAPKNEAHVLKLIENYTTIPAPRLIDTWEHDGVPHLLMTRAPGVPVEDICHLMSYAERDRFADDMRDYIAQLRRIPNTTPYLICDALGGRIVDHRLPDSGRGGPFKKEADFNDHLAYHLGGSFAKVAKWKEFTPREHSKFYFTHSDLHPTNILVENGRLSAIVDWESAGFRPEYWEFTKAMYGSGAGSPGIMTSIWWRTFGREYEPELEIEKKLWWVTPFGS
ncbi:kinase-like domain-containing protein [Aspergillus carlsbadensis]|nr:kinase-like domain-containing protein [Aspergillus carlsbadensis]